MSENSAVTLAERYLDSQESSSGDEVSPAYPLLDDITNPLSVPEVTTPYFNEHSDFLTCTINVKNHQILVNLQVYRDNNKKEIRLFLEYYVGSERRELHTGVSLGQNNCILLKSPPLRGICLCVRQLTFEPGNPTYWLVPLRLFNESAL